MGSDLAMSGLSIVIPSIKMPTVRRINDRLIMDIAAEIGMTRGELTKLNYCRLYLLVESIADLSTTDGKRILPTLNNSTPHVTSKSSHLWPVQKLPGSRAWAVFRKFLRAITAPKTRVLKTTLGPWINTDNREWPFYLEIDSGYIAKRSTIEGQKWEFFNVGKDEAGITEIDLSAPIDSDYVPENIKPIDVVSKDRNEKRIGRINTIELQTNLAISGCSRGNNVTWEDAAKSLDTWERDLIINTTITQPTMLMGRTTVIVNSHTQHGKEIGSFLWIWSCSDDHDIANGWGRVFGYNNMKKSKMYGCASVLVVCHRYCEFFRVRSKQVSHHYITWKQTNRCTAEMRGT